MAAETAGRRVLFIGLSTYGAHGGIQRFNRRVAAAIARIGLPRHLLMLGDSQAQVAAAIPDGEGAGGSKAAFARAFARRARHSDILLVGHVNLMPFALLYRLLRPRGRVILFAHGVEVWDDPYYRRRTRYDPLLIAAAVDRVAVVSRYTQGRMAAAFRIPQDRFALFPNAVTLVPAPPPRAATGSILAVSRLGAGETGKHVDKLVRAMPAVAAAAPDAMLTIIGDGVLRESLAALAAELGVADRVMLRGTVSDGELDAAYRDAALFALPSSKEGFGIVYLEAWLHGLPVIASRFGGGGEVVSDGVDGFTVDPEDVPALAGRIVTLLRDPALAARFAAAGRAKVEARYSDAAFVANLAGLCGAPPPAAG